MQFAFCSCNCVRYGRPQAGFVREFDARGSRESIINVLTFSVPEQEGEGSIDKSRVVGSAGTSQVPGNDTVTIIKTIMLLCLLCVFYSPCFR